MNENPYRSRHRQGFYNPYTYNPYHAYPHHPGVNYKYSTGMPTPFEIFSKPKQPASWQPNFHTENGYYPPPRPRPKNSNLLYYFQNNDGELDINKMLSTVNQAANVVQQITPLVKQFGSFMKPPNK